jgi:histidine triad (HIT) family protein
MNSRAEEIPCRILERKNLMSSDCLFCKIGDGSIPSEKIYESDTLFAINDINPQAPTHILIIPRVHQTSLLDVEESDHEMMGSIITVANQLAKERGLDKSGYRLVVNCGEGAGQSVLHIHYHILGGRPLKWPPG